MGKLTTITRRTFLISSAAIAGGVAFGVYKVKQTPNNPLIDDLETDAATFNPWVLVDSEKVTLIAPHADKGQGIASAQAALIAEEMDLEWGGFDTSFGKPGPAYWNTAMADEGVPFMRTDNGVVAEGLRDVVGGVIKLIGLQATGGSTSMPDSFDKLRRAGAVARETLKLAASRKTGVPVAELKTESGFVILPDDTRLPYTGLALEAAQLEPVDVEELRDPSQWKLIGKRMPRLDMLAKSTGTQVYGIDLSVPDMVYATVKINPRQGGALNSFDASDASAMRGVLDIVEITHGVAVIATNTWYAIQAANAIKFDWAHAPYPAEQDAHWQAVNDSFTEDRLDKQWRHDGDVDLALADSAVFSAEYRSAYVAHQPLEPLNAIVKVSDDEVQVWTGNQLPRILQEQVAGITGHDPEQVVFHNQFMGGSFGHRLELEYVKIAAEIANKMRGTPVKMTFSREEDFAHDFTRPIAMARGSGAVRQGHVHAIDLGIASPSPISSQLSRVGITLPGPDPQIAAGAWNNPYIIPNYRMRAYRTPELAPVSSWRAVGPTVPDSSSTVFWMSLSTKQALTPCKSAFGSCNMSCPEKCWKPWPTCRPGVASYRLGMAEELRL